MMALLLRPTTIPFPLKPSPKSKKMDHNVNNKSSIASFTTTTTSTERRKLPILLFDIMDTIVRDPFYHDIPAFFRMSFKELIECKHPTAWNEFEKGLINETELAQKFFKDGRPLDLEGLKDCMRRGYSYIEGVEELLNDLKKNNYEMHAFTNYPIWYKMIEDKLKISTYLSWTFCSCITGKQKPEPDFYLEVLRHLEVEPASCIFIDDRLRNVEAAVDAGIIGLHFKNADSLRQDLSQLGIEMSTEEHNGKHDPVEELAFLIKDNLPCKHLVLSMEEAFVNFLHDDTSPDGVMELEPMNPYKRLLLHRLADIFGFAHESIGEGDDRHLILERCPETSIPSILVSDILWQYDESQYPTTSHQLLKRKEASPVPKTKTPSFQNTLEEREAAYLAARERIFSMDEGEIKESVKQKPRNIPVVARRMIAHALGQRIKPCNQVTLTDNNKEYEGLTEELSFQEKDKAVADLSVEAYQESICQSHQNVNSQGKTKGIKPNSSASAHREKKVSQKLADNKSTNGGISRKGGNGLVVCKDNLKEEHLGAAKRMFAHALGLHSAKDGLLSKCREAKQIDTE